MSIAFKKGPLEAYKLQKLQDSILIFRSSQTLRGPTLEESVKFLVAATDKVTRSYTGLGLALYLTQIQIPTA
ncbi:hypothetical protein J6590_088964 [Homalodisca vitripennis]|nr:hypothetical protein J6590_088964 [Homalodisca vitripennis]